jgi:putative membrane protein insertion efficiency factor
MSAALAETSTKGKSPEERKMLDAVWRLPRRGLIGLVKFYRQAISPYFGSGKCRFTPTCSEYAIQALREYGAVKGLVLSVWRVLRCNPWGGHGYDPPRWFGEEIDHGNNHDGTGGSHGS